MVAKEREGAVSGGDKVGNEVGYVFTVVGGVDLEMRFSFGSECGSSIWLFGFVLGFTFLSSFSPGGGGLICSTSGGHVTTP